ncbi:MAG: regulatory protein GemA, partial [Pseudolabrys sp.]
AKQISMIHVLAKKAGMDDDTRRGFIQREAGVASARELSVSAAGAVIEKLLPLAGQPAKGAVAGLDTPIGGKLRALWISGYNLGLIRDRTDRAMLSFLERQTGVSHTRFLREPAQATAAIEALRRWLARDGKVEWPTADDDDACAKKRAVINAQWLRLVDICAVTLSYPGAPFEELENYAFKVASKYRWELFDAGDYDKVQQALGRKLRFELSKRAGEPPRPDKVVER